MEQIQDNEMDRYETLVDAVRSLVDTEWIVYETDKAKGDRITLIDIAGEIVDEKKFSRGNNK